MDNRQNIQDELKSLQSSLTASNDPAPFAVPEGYFDGLSASVLAKIKGAEPSAGEEISGLSPLLAGISRKTAYSVPSGYFEDSLLSLTALGAEPESPVLQSIGKTIPYTIPDGYFETVPQAVMNRVVQPAVKVVPLFARRWIRMAAAAVVGGALCVAGLRYFGTTDNAQPFATDTNRDTAKTEMAKTNASPLPELKTVSTTELDAFVNEVRAPITKSGTTTQQSKTVEVKALLKDVSASEMEEFLSEVPTLDEDLFTTDVP